MNSNMLRLSTRHIIKKIRLKNSAFSSGSDDVVNITFATPGKKSTGQEETRVHVQAKVGDNILRLAQRNDIPLEGACEGACWVFLIFYGINVAKLLSSHFLHVLVTLFCCPHKISFYFR